MDWNNLKEGKCPKCGGTLGKIGNVWICEKTYSKENCDFSIRAEKLNDLAKGKESVAYKKKMEHYKGLKKRSAQNKKKREETSQILKAERLSNLRRMLSKGEISQEEYDKKVAV